MNDFESVKSLIIQTIKERSGSFDGDSLEADYRMNWDEDLSEVLEYVLCNMSNAAFAKQSGDDVMLKVALMNSCIRLKELFFFFRDIQDDLEAFVLESGWPEVPEGYVYKEKLK
ncbi:MULTISPECIES: hypothetical protein [unclassified Pseudomonas]|uniref:hypothetical protein n=1 Tax=unclassified Pseudomonas TaxID=196821 RepID=UPI000A1D942C|nr:MULTISPECIES: hypothetical protein [unclassified Pseudomonas]